MLWEASVLDPNEVNVFESPSFSHGNSDVGYPLPWPYNSRLPKTAASSSGWERDDGREHAMALAHRSSTHRGSDSRPLSRARRERQPAALYRETCGLVSTSLTKLWFFFNSQIRLPSTLHPMTQLGIGVAALNHDSAFQAAYEKGIKKSEYWTYTLEDCISLIARLPALAARIYRNVYRPGTAMQSIDKGLDLVG